MGFVFRIEQVDTRDETTLLTGRLLSGQLTWRQSVEVQSENTLETVFRAPLRGVALVDHEVRSELMSLDPSCWDSSLVLPITAHKEKRIRLVLDGMPDPRESRLSVPGIALGVDDAAAPEAEALPTAIRSAETVDAVHSQACWLEAGTAKPPALAGIGTPVREYPYHFSRRDILMFAPWFLLITLAIPLGVFAVGLGNGTLANVDFAKWFSFSLIGLVDVFLLYISVQMLLSKTSHIVVTTTGIVLPVFLPGFISEDVFLSFMDLEAMLECWHVDSLRLIRLKTPRGAFSVHGTLMKSPQFEELRHLLWKKANKDLPDAD